MSNYCSGCGTAWAGTTHICPPIQSSTRTGVEVSVTTTPETDALNMVTLNVVERLNEAQEQALRKMLADAWDDGHRVGRNHVVSGHWNPYRDAAVDPERGPA